MNQAYRNKSFPLSNPLANLLVIIVGTLAIGVSIVIGFFAFLTLGALLLVIAAIVGIRVWWLNRKIARQYAVQGGRPSARSAKIEVIEGEYQVISRQKPTDRRPGP